MSDGTEDWRTIGHVDDVPAGSMRDIRVDEIPDPAIVAPTGSRARS